MTTNPNPKDHRMTDYPTFESQAELAKAMASPEYSTSPRYRDQIAAKLQASIDAGTIKSPGQFVAYGDTIHTKSNVLVGQGEAIWSPGTNPMPKSDPKWVEAGRIESGFFSGPDEIANAMAAPHFDIDEGYKRAVADKIGRSIREGFISTTFEPLDPSKRFSR